jgi:hypothetical protein
MEPAAFSQPNDLGQVTASVSPFQTVNDASQSMAGWFFDQENQRGRQQTLNEVSQPWFGDQENQRRLQQTTQAQPLVQSQAQAHQPSSAASYQTVAAALGPTLSPSYAAAAVIQAGPMDFLPPASQPAVHQSTAHNSILSVDPPLIPLDASTGQLGTSWDDCHDYQNDFMNFPSQHSLANAGGGGGGGGSELSPTNTYIEVHSQTSDHPDWATITLINAPEGLHIRSNSNSSTDAPGYGQLSTDFEDVDPAMASPSSDSHLEFAVYHGSRHHAQHQHLHQLSQSPPWTATGAVAIASPPPAPITMTMRPSVPTPLSTTASASPSAAVGPLPVETFNSFSDRSPISNSSTGSTSPTRRLPKKPPIPKPSKPGNRRPPIPGGRKDNEKKVGRRRGPLGPEQRKQANEIRKLRACLRCKFLKKVCDKGEPCAGCKPSHARLWQVPCTRIDVKNVADFMKDWRADYERHVRLEYSVGNIRGFSCEERTIYITHGFGFVIPVVAREVYVRDEECFTLDWVETLHESPVEFTAPTARLSTGAEGISTDILSKYLDKHIDESFERWVDDHLEGTVFLTGLLKTAYRFYLRERVEIIRKALKLVLAYNLTLHLTLVHNSVDEDQIEGVVTDESSKFRGKTLAPVLINFEIKCGLAKIWRELQKEVLEELSALYSGVYSGEKLKNWPIIFLLVAILLIVWEEMQFDCHYRVADQAVAAKFCHDMENVPVGVIIGLFAAISHQLPAFTEWDTAKHHQLLNSNEAVCDALTEVRENVTMNGGFSPFRVNSEQLLMARLENYLRSRADATFDRHDFDSLSNKFLSRLVIRAN